MGGNFADAVRLQSVRRQIDVSHAVVANEKIDDLGQLFTQGRLAAAEPQDR